MWVVAFSFSHIPSYRNVLNILMAIVRRTSPAPPRKQQQAVQQSRLLSLIHSDTPTLKLLLDDSMWTTCWTLSNIIPNRKRRTSPQHSTAVICYLFPFCNYTVVCFLKIFYIVCMYSFVSTYVHILNKWLVRGQVCMLYYLHIFALFSSRGVAFQINKADVERLTNGSPPILNH